jgi:hypothetical protein
MIRHFLWFKSFQVSSAVGIKDKMPRPTTPFGGLPHDIWQTTATVKSLPIGVIKHDVVVFDVVSFRTRGFVK